MTVEALTTGLTNAGFKVFYGNVPDDTLPPFLVYINIDHPNFAADNRTYQKTTSLDIRLVEAEVHDWSLIAKLEKTLDDLGLTYSSTDLADVLEGVCETNYYLRFVGGIK